ncbi:DVU_1555 family C-GCAxxG-C-C protein [Desulfohalobium retbaense]|uniref:C_GCAxxG_C_C family protein n=1 Tax=Desulfohalobium retbaense (strain ATCC 49708 / DSM 5692 / JCM 16813 / HR100) TaxID=485915 RepID=C8X3U9_DESRD|nr:DV_1555 family C-GCAxxG-C-C protein [Desulfohalobium retbaense]ACV69096.1 C_GCAxxG_C_C family protein [Desulfohalobium retbaense DSM 5692]
MEDDTLFRVLPLAQQGYCCSQIILRLGLEYQGASNPALIRAASGLCHGVGGCGHTCGALTGGACLLGLYAGKGQDNEEAHSRFPLMLETLGHWFADTACAAYAGTTCQAILGENTTQPNPDICGRLIADTLDQCLTILMDNGIDPTEGPDAV